MQFLCRKWNFETEKVVKCKSPKISLSLDVITSLLIFGPSACMQLAQSCECVVCVYNMYGDVTCKSRRNVIKKSFSHICFCIFSLLLHPNTVTRALLLLAIAPWWVVRALSEEIIIYRKKKSFSFSFRFVFLCVFVRCFLFFRCGDAFVVVCCCRRCPQWWMNRLALAVMET